MVLICTTPLSISPTITVIINYIDSGKYKNIDDLSYPAELISLVYSAPEDIPHRTRGKEICVVQIQQKTIHLKLYGVCFLLNCIYPTLHFHISPS